jgi:hypothetical protein
MSASENRIDISLWDQLKYGAAETEEFIRPYRLPMSENTLLLRNQALIMRALIDLHETDRGCWFNQPLPRLPKSKLVHFSERMNACFGSRRTLCGIADASIAASEDWTTTIRENVTCPQCITRMNS